MSGPEGPQRGLRVVVADNDPDALDLIAIDLSLEGHAVVGKAVSGEEAIQLCEQLHPDVLVVDHRMPPGQTGLEVLKVLHAQRDLRIVLYTNYCDLRLRREAERLHATFLLKGDLGALRAAVIGAA